MNFFPLWKKVTVFTVTFLVLIVLINVVLNYTRSAPLFGYLNKVKLGLDLQGGSHLLLEIDKETIKQDFVKNLRNNVVSFIESEEIVADNISLSGQEVHVLLQDKESASSLKKKLYFYDNSLDITNQNDTTLIVKPTEDTYKEQFRAVVENTMEVLRRRLDQSGTNDVFLQQSGDSFIIVQLPGVDDPERVKEILGKTARLSFHIVDLQATNSQGNLPLSKVRLYERGTGISYAVDREPLLTGKNLTDSKVEFQDNAPVVYFNLDNQGGKIFADITANNIGSMLAIVLDNEIISAPRINSVIPSGSGIITGRFTVQEAQDLSLLLKAGSLPVDLKIAEERVVGPTLGHDSVVAGIKAIVIGFILTLLFIVYFYGKLGVIAGVSLIANVGIIIFAITALGVSLTLPGIAGIVLTIGIAIDANILVYERYRSELQTTNSKVEAMRRSFDRMVTAIFDSNTTGLITALLLFNLGSGPIKGFAITLIVGILTSLFSIFFITKGLVARFFLK